MDTGQYKETVLKNKPLIREQKCTFMTYKNTTVLPPKTASDAIMINSDGNFRNRTISKICSSLEVIK